MSYFGNHNHTDRGSNNRLKDSTNKVEELMDKALELGLKGIAITDHESLSNHIYAHKHYMDNQEKFGDFTLALGNEIYCVDEYEFKELRANNERIEFFHLILVAKDMIGYQQIKKLSDWAWDKWTKYRGGERVPTYKQDLFRVVSDNPGHIICSTACLGGELPFYILKMRDSEEGSRDYKYSEKRIRDFCTKMSNVFREDFYLELQPSDNEDQIYVNNYLLDLGRAYNIKCILSTDSHYLTKEEKKTHEIFLKSRMNDMREEQDFYATCYLMSEEEIKPYFGEDYNTLKENSLELASKIGEYTFKKDYKMPPAKMPEQFDSANKLMSYISAPTKNSFEYMRKFYNSEYKIDRWYLKLIEEGLEIYEDEVTYEMLERIELELMEIWQTSEHLDQRVSKYFVITKDIVDLMWEYSIVGVSRGSACCYYTNYLLGIVQVSAITYDLPHWRFLSADRPTMPDIDLDTEASQRAHIIEGVKSEYGIKNVLNIGTFTTQAIRSTITDVAVGYGYSREVGQNIANTFPMENKEPWEMHDAFFGNEDKNRKPCKQFINAIAQFMDCTDNERFKEIRTCMLKINGLVAGRSQHASGVVIFPDGYLEDTCRMKTSDGLDITQFDAGDVEYCGGTKLDFLTVTALDRLRTTLDLLLHYNVIEWQGSLRKTYDKYLHPKNIDVVHQGLFDTIFSGEVFDLFQFSTLLGASTIKKLNARTFAELCAANSLMRLTIKEGEQPLDRFIRFRDNPGAWDAEMDAIGLNEDEKQILHRYLDRYYGVCSTQEDIMRLIHDHRIGNYTMSQANGYRKLIAKKNKKKFNAEKEVYLKRGMDAGNRQIFLEYVWKFMFEPASGYAFSDPHILGYTLIGIQEAFLCEMFGSIWWKTGCLLINSGMTGDNEKGVDYGFMASAIMPMRDDVVPPSINDSAYEFTPNTNINKIVYGLKPIKGLGKDIAKLIVEGGRPYLSFDDFYSKLGSKISYKKMIILIKAGCFDEFGEDRKSLIVRYIKKIKPTKKPTMTQFPIIIEELGNIPGLEFEINLFNFRKIAKSKNKIDKVIIDAWQKWFIENVPKGKVGYCFDDNGIIQMDNTQFENYYKDAIEPLREEISKEKYWDIVANYQRRKIWVEECLGTKEKWEMETLNLYFGKHELDDVDLTQYYDISSFEDLSEEPTLVDVTNRYGKVYKQPLCYDIAGTVVDKNKDKSTITLITQQGVVNVKIPRGKYKYYDERVVNDGKVVEKGWFEKGNILVITGFRDGEVFINRKPNNKATSIIKLFIYNGEITIQQDRY